MRVHFIAIGGSAMHNLALAMSSKGYVVTGSDDEIFEPSKSRLSKAGILPKQWGWFPENISNDLDAIILGMHARKDNPELVRALELGLKVYSYPEYLYTQTTDKKRVVVGGSHGKTSVTSMIMHVLKVNGVDFDYMVGAQLDGFDTMVKLTHEAPIAIFEGDEYLSSPIDLRPKFLWYKPHIAVLTGIAWDHINVFPTFENYCQQFSNFVNTIEPNGTLIYFEGDKEIVNIASDSRNDITKIAYHATQYRATDDGVVVIHNNSETNLPIFGNHNMQNVQAAYFVCEQLGISESDFYSAIQSFKGAARRLQTLVSQENFNVYFDFAHSPSKLKATTNAVKEQYPNHKLIACMELHTFSSLNKAFLPQYEGSMNEADEAYVYFNPKVVEHKKLESFSIKEVELAFNHPNLLVFTDSQKLFAHLKTVASQNTTLLMMTSGNFDGQDIKQFANDVAIHLQCK